jgi:hypothetical protein
MITFLRGVSMREVIFIVTEPPEGGYIAEALGASIVTDGEDIPSLRERVHEAVLCHFAESEMPSTITLRFVREDVIAV